MSENRVFIGLTQTFIQEKIKDGSVVDYLTDPESASISTTKGETSVGLSKIRNIGQIRDESGVVTDGVVETYKDDMVTILLSDGTKVVSKFKRLNISQHSASDNSYIVNFPTEAGSDDPTLNYFTDSITWEPNLVLDFQNKFLSMNAVIKSTRRNPYTGDFTVVLISTKHTTHYTKRPQLARAVMSDASSVGSSSDDITTTRPLIYKVGTMTMPDIFRFPLKTGQVNLTLRNFIEVSRWDGNTEGPAESGFLFDSPFYFPNGTLLVRQNHINTTVDISSHQENEPVMVRTYLSDKIRYKSFLTDTIVDESSSVKKRQIRLKIHVDKNTDRAENVTIIFNVGDIGECEVDPKPTEGIQKPGRIMWNVTANMNAEYFEAIIGYKS
jgi:hypothetical protein